MLGLIIIILSLVEDAFTATFKHMNPEKPGFYGVEVDENDDLRFVEIKHKTQKKKTTNSDSVTAWNFSLVQESLAIKRIFDQGSCGGCWSFSSVDVTGSSMYLNGKGNRVFSPQYLVNCRTTEKYGGYEYTQQGCDGGYPIIAFIDIKRNGICEYDCVKWVGDPGRYSACPTKCDNNSNIVKYKDSSFNYYDAYQMDLQFLRNLVTTSGPCVAEMDVYSDLMLYTEGVYEHKVGGTTEGHAVTVYGFGTENGKNYWLIKNSWGVGWGLNGFFKIRMGTNESGIEENFYSLYYHSVNYNIPLPPQTVPGEYWNGGYTGPSDPGSDGISMGVILLIVLAVAVMVGVVVLVVCLIIHRKCLCCQSQSGSRSAGSVAPTNDTQAQARAQAQAQTEMQEMPPRRQRQAQAQQRQAQPRALTPYSYPSNGYSNSPHPRGIAGPPQHYYGSGNGRRTTYFGS